MSDRSGNLHAVGRYRWWSIVAACLLLSACAGLLGPRTVEVPLQRLQSSVDRKFPFNQRLFELIDMRLVEPQLSVVPGSDRLRVAMQASVAPIFTSRSWRGNFVLSGRLQIDPARRAVMLVEPQFEQISLAGIDPALSAQVARAADLLAAQILRDAPLYTFDANDLRYGGSRFLPTQITTNANGLVITFAPAD